VVLEREGGPREEGSAITFWPNAFRVLDALGAAAPVRDTHPLLRRCADLALTWRLCIADVARASGRSSCEVDPCFNILCPILCASVHQTEALEFQRCFSALKELSASETAPLQP
jgi:hypothetical protein